MVGADSVTVVASATKGNFNRDRLVVRWFMEGVLA